MWRDVMFSLTLNASAKKELILYSTHWGLSFLLFLWRFNLILNRRHATAFLPVLGRKGWKQASYILWYKITFHACKNKNKRRLFLINSNFLKHIHYRIHQMVSPLFCGNESTNFTEFYLLLSIINVNGKFHFRGKSTYVLSILFLTWNHQFTNLRNFLNLKGAFYSVIKKS